MGKTTRKPLQIGAQYGELVVLSTGFKEPGAKHFKVRCRCSCGVERNFLEYHLRSGHTKSCGHMRTALSKSRALINGQPRKTLRSYKAWLAMRARVSRSPHYSDVDIDPAWDSFEQFLDDMGEPDDPALTLDRIDPWKGYSKENCRWASWDEQANNRRDSVNVEYGGKRQTLARWSRELGVPYLTLRGRLAKGRSPQEAFETALRPSGHVIEFQGKKQTLSEWARETGMPARTLHYRLMSGGWSIEAALTFPPHARGGKHQGEKYALVSA